MNIFQHLHRAAIFFPDKTALLFEERSITYKELGDVVRGTLQA